MNYFEITVQFSVSHPWKDIFISLLADYGFESFADGETEEILLAYIPKNLFDEKRVQYLFKNHSSKSIIQYTIKEIEEQNWNLLWESNYEPVFIANRCFIRAPFHETNPDAEYEIVIEPKMSFGTAHHETTSLMIEFMLEENVNQKSVLDMGSGTGILAILAYLKGAKQVTAIDNDEWAYLNAIENSKKNKAESIDVKLGDAASLTECGNFDIIVANINRNILLADLPTYVKVLDKNGTIFLSGFYVEEDFKLITQKCKELEIGFVAMKEKNKWCAGKFKKNS